MARSRCHSKDSRKFHSWIDNAEEDIIAAELLMQNHRCFKNSVFHCQQTVEKSLKAYVLFESDRLIDGHNLLWLCRQASNYDSRFIDWMDECAFLNHSYIETRYPSDIFFEISESQIKKSFSIAKKIFNFICNIIYEKYTEKPYEQDCLDDV